VPDQIGFGRSSKPIIPYNFHDMALNTRTLLQSLGITRAVIVGHSMGGMLTARFAASYPDITERAVIYDPIGLSDVRWETPWHSAEEAYKAAMARTNDQAWQMSLANIQRYFPGAWKPEYEQYVRILYAPTLSADWPRLAMVRSIYQQMPYLDPVVYDWAHIKVKTLVCLVGQISDLPPWSCGPPTKHENHVGQALSPVHPDQRRQGLARFRPTLSPPWSRTHVFQGC
jgi:pimeloyl-ACP methyl ester carboxylesterase